MRSGVYALKNAVAALPALPGKRTALGRALGEWRDGLIADLGGEPSTAQLALIDMATLTGAIVVALGVLLSWMFGLEGRGVAVVGDIPAMLPSLGMPRAADLPFATLALGASAIFLVSFGSGLVTATPAGVPVSTRSPGSSVIKELR